MADRPTCKKPSLFPWFTFVWTIVGVVGLVVIPRVTPAKARPAALVAAPAAVETQVRQLAARVELLEREVQELRSSPVAAIRQASLVRGDR